MVAEPAALCALRPRGGATICLVSWFNNVTRRPTDSDGSHTHIAQGHRLLHVPAICSDLFPQWNKLRCYTLSYELVLLFTGSNASLAGPACDFRGKKS